MTVLSLQLAFHLIVFICGATATIGVSKLPCPPKEFVN